MSDYMEHWIWNAIYFCLQRIVKNAETMALQLYSKTKKLDINHTYCGTKADDPEGDPLHHVIGLDVTENSHFRGEPVNLTYSSVHIPTNVYNRGEILGTFH